MISEIGHFFLALALGFACVQSLASFWGVLKDSHRFLVLGKIATFLQGGFIMGAFLVLMVAFWVCDFSIATVAFHDHTYLPWYYRLAATWGNHEGSLLFFVLILSGIGVALALFLPHSLLLLKARALSVQGLLIFLFLLFLILTSNPFTLLPIPFLEGSSLNPLLQDRGLLIHPPLLYLGYVGFSAPFSLAIASLLDEKDVQTWNQLVRPWVLFAWGSLTAGITLGSWWAYYELGWGGWWFWDPVENASFMPWLAGTALLHTLRTQTLYRWSLFLSLITFELSLLGTFLVRSGLIASVHSFAQDPERGLFILSLLGGLMGFGFLMWIWKAPSLQSPPVNMFSRKGALLLNSLFLVGGLAIILLGTLYPLWSDWMWNEKMAIGAPYFEKTFIPLMIPLLIFIPIGSLLRGKEESLFHLLMAPLTATLAAGVLLLYVFDSTSLWSGIGIIVAIWVLGGTLLAFLKNKLLLGPALAHFGVGIALLGVSVGGGYRSDESRIMGLQDRLQVGGLTLTLDDVQQGKESTYFYERASLSSPNGVLKPEKRLYLPQNSLFNETAILTNGFKDIYVVLGPYQGDHQWLIRASSIPLAPWIWIGGAFMVLGSFLSFIRRKHALTLLLILLPSFSFAESSLEKRANSLFKEVRCPVCAGQSIAESETPESKALKGFILEQLNEDKSDEVIRDELRTLFGEEILFHPPFQLNTLFLWLAPFGIFLLICLGLFWKAYRSKINKR